jgi:hypothetical protein
MACPNGGGFNVRLNWVTDWLSEAGRVLFDGCTD